MIRVSQLANVTINLADKKDMFEVDKQGLWTILAAALTNTDFDSDYYVETNKDVKEGIKKGEIISGFDHFVKFGFLEGRRGWRLKVDERFYISYYEDVRQSIKNGDFKNGQEHFDAVGESEGRLPYSGFTYFNNSKKPSAFFGKSRREPAR